MLNQRNLDKLQQLHTLYGNNKKKRSESPKKQRGRNREIRPQHRVPFRMSQSVDTFFQQRIDDMLERQSASKVSLLSIGTSSLKFMRPPPNRNISSDNNRQYLANTMSGFQDLMLHSPVNALRQHPVLKHTQTQKKQELQKISSPSELYIVDSSTPDIFFEQNQKKQQQFVAETRISLEVQVNEKSEVPERLVSVEQQKKEEDENINQEECMYSSSVSYSQLEDLEIFKIKSKTNSHSKQSSPQITASQALSKMNSFSPKISQRNSEMRQSVNQNIKKSYTSRKDLNFSDSESNDSCDCHHFQPRQSVFQQFHTSQTELFKKIGSPNIQKRSPSISFNSKNLEFKKSSVNEQSTMLRETGEEFAVDARFKNYTKVFNNLTKSHTVTTMYPIVSCMITYNSQSVVTVTKKNDREYLVKQYDIENYNLTFEERIGGNKDDYIKLKEVEQNSEGNKFAISYMNNGVFKLRTFGQKCRNDAQIERNDFNINEALGLNNFTMPINNFPDPFITCTWIHDDLIFVNLYHNHSITHYHFFFHVSSRKITSLAKVNLQSNNKNFPYKCFYNSELNQVYSFYRQCQAFEIPVFEVDHPQNKYWKSDDGKNYSMEIIHNRDLGTMYMINNKALVARCSSQILFFKKITDEFTNETRWVKYHDLQLRGFLYFIKGNKRIQITTDQKIYFYLIDPVTFMPTLENVMFNFMSCSQMMFGSRVRYCVTYKTNQKSFAVYRRQFEHNFKVNAVRENYDGSCGVYISSINTIIVSSIDQIKFYDGKTFKEMTRFQIDIPLFKSDTREPNQIISIQLSQCNRFIAVISGKKLIMNQQFPNQLFIFKSQASNQPGRRKKFELIKRIVIREKPEFKGICMSFSFKKVRRDSAPNTLIFAKEDSLIELNFETEEVKEIIRFMLPLDNQPEFFKMSDNQNYGVVANNEDCIFVDLKRHKLTDINDDGICKISSIKDIIFDEDGTDFYIMCNQHIEKIGLYLIRFNLKNLNDHEFLLRWQSKLDIDDCTIIITKNKEKMYKELIMSYKSIFINTLTVQVIDISGSNKSTVVRHESFCLWESKVRSIWVGRSKQLILLNKDGIEVLDLSEEQFKTLTDSTGQQRMIHSLTSTGFLKVDKHNFFNIEFSSDIKTITVAHQFTSKKNEEVETSYEAIYGLRIHEITLRELLLFKSLFYSKTQSDILHLIKSQPEPAVFFKSSFELNLSNMVSILSFDSRLLRVLLDDSNSKYFSMDYPLFYRNKIQKSNSNKYFFRTPIESALKNNQIRAVSYIIDYVCKYQNDVITSYWFIKVLPEMLMKGIKVASLFKSKIFIYVFEFDDWPQSHKDSSFMLLPYNGGIFQLRDMYKDTVGHKLLEKNNQLTFWKSHFDKDENSKVNKVKYTLNLIPLIESWKKHDGCNLSIMKLICDSDEIEIFQSRQINDVIDFKWQQFAKNLHLRGFFFHLINLATVSYFVHEVYVENHVDEMTTHAIVLLVGMIYPIIQILIHVFRVGIVTYLLDQNGFVQVCQMVVGILMIVMQFNLPPQSFLNKLITSFLLLLQLLKSFFYLKIFEQFSYIVTMINRVIKHLQIFMIFLFILLFIFGMIFSVIGVGNPNIPDSGFRNYSQQLMMHNKVNNDLLILPNKEYNQIGIFVGNMFMVLRMMLGDFDFHASEYLFQEENFLFWITAFLVIMMTCIVFLNFLIAEVGNTYNQINKQIKSFVYQEKARLVLEAEHLMFDQQKHPNNFPMYLIKREIEN